MCTHIYTHTSLKRGKKKKKKPTRPCFITFLSKTKLLLPKTELKMDFMVGWLVGLFQDS